MSLSSVVPMAPVPLPPPTTGPAPVSDPLPTSNRPPFVPQTPSRPKRDENSVPWGPQRHNRAMARGNRRVSFGPLPERDDGPETPSKPSRRSKRPKMKRRNATKEAPSYGGKDGRQASVTRDAFSIASPDEFLAMVTPEPRQPPLDASVPTYIPDNRMLCDRCVVHHVSYGSSILTYAI